MKLLSVTPKPASLQRLYSIMEVDNVATANQICDSWGNTITVRNQFTQGRAAIYHKKKKSQIKLDIVINELSYI